MRCTRCDRPAIPQAVGISADGKVVFGWCVTCLEEKGCRDIVVAPRKPHVSTRLILTDRRLPRLWSRLQRRSFTSWPHLRSIHASSFEGAGQIVAALAVSLAIWGMVLATGGVILHARRGAVVTTPLGSGTPALLIVGGTLTVGFAFLLLLVNLKAETWRSPAVMIATYWISLITGVGLAFQLFFRGTTFRDVGFVAVAALCLLIAFLARLNRSKSHKLGAGDRSPF